MTTLPDLEPALEPFTTFAQESVEKTDSGWQWSSGLGRDRICDWFGPSDFGLLAYFAEALAARSAPPVGWQWKTLDTWHTIDKSSVSDPEAYAKAQASGGQYRPIYAAPLDDAELLEATEAEVKRLLEAPQAVPAEDVAGLIEQMAEAMWRAEVKDFPAAAKVRAIAPWSEESPNVQAKWRALASVAAGTAAAALTSLSAERDSWRRVAERLEGEKQASEAEATSLRRRLEEARSLAEQAEHCIVGYAAKANIEAAMHRLAERASSVLAALTGASDDDFIAGVRAKIEAALSTEAAPVAWLRRRDIDGPCNAIPAWKTQSDGADVAVYTAPISTESGEAEWFCRACAWTGTEPESVRKYQPPFGGYTAPCCPNCGHFFNEHEIARYAAPLPEDTHHGR